MEIHRDGCATALGLGRVYGGACMLEKWWWEYKHDEEGKIITLIRRLGQCDANTKMVIK